MASGLFGYVVSQVLGVGSFFCEPGIILVCNQGYLEWIQSAVNECGCMFSSANVAAILVVRYPMFIDALRDLDHCLTMVHLFAALHAIERESIQPERIHNS
ncbi:pescadillo [Tanacetum coccineum]